MSSHQELLNELHFWRIIFKKREMESKFQEQEINNRSRRNLVFVGFLITYAITVMLFEQIFVQNSDKPAKFYQYYLTNIVISMCYFVINHTCPSFYTYYHWTYIYAISTNVCWSIYDNDFMQFETKRTFSYGFITAYMICSQIDGGTFIPKVVLISVLCFMFVTSDQLSSGPLQMKNLIRAVFPIALFIMKVRHEELVKREIFFDQCKIKDMMSIIHNQIPTPFIIAKLNKKESTILFTKGNIQANKQLGIYNQETYDSFMENSYLIKQVEAHTHPHTSHSTIGPDLNHHQLPSQQTDQGKSIQFPNSPFLDHPSQDHSVITYDSLNSLKCLIRRKVELLLKKSDPRPSSQKKPKDLQANPIRPCVPQTYDLQQQQQFSTSQPPIGSGQTERIGELDSKSQSQPYIFQQQFFFQSQQQQLQLQHQLEDPQQQLEEIEQQYIENNFSIDFLNSPEFLDEEATYYNTFSDKRRQNMTNPMNNQIIKSSQQLLNSSPQSAQNIHNISQSFNQAPPPPAMHSGKSHSNNNPIPPIPSSFNQQPNRNKSTSIFDPSQIKSQPSQVSYQQQPLSQQPKSRDSSDKNPIRSSNQVQIPFYQQSQNLIKIPNVNSSNSYYHSNSQTVHTHTTTNNIHTNKLRSQTLNSLNAQSITSKKMNKKKMLKPIDEENFEEKINVEYNLRTNSSSVPARYCVRYHFFQTNEIYIVLVFENESYKRKYKHEKLKNSLLSSIRSHQQQLIHLNLNKINALLTNLSQPSLNSAESAAPTLPLLAATLVRHQQGLTELLACLLSMNVLHHAFMLFNQFLLRTQGIHVPKHTEHINTVNVTNLLHSITASLSCEAKLCDKITLETQTSISIISNEFLLKILLFSVLRYFTQHTLPVESKILVSIEEKQSDLEESQTDQKPLILTTQTYQRECIQISVKLPFCQELLKILEASDLFFFSFEALLKDELSGELPRQSAWILRTSSQIISQLGPFARLNIESDYNDFMIVSFLLYKDLTILTKTISMNPKPSQSMQKQQVIQQQPQLSSHLPHSQPQQQQQEQNQLHSSHSRSAQFINSCVRNQQPINLKRGGLSSSKKDSISI